MEARDVRSAGSEVVMFKRLVMVSFTELLTFEQRSKEGKRDSHVNIGTGKNQWKAQWQENIPGVLENSVAMRGREGEVQGGHLRACKDQIS